MKRSVAWLIYFTCMAISITMSIILSAISKSESNTFMLVCAGVNLAQYFVIGILLNRKVLRNLITWHPVNATIHNMVSTKMIAFFFWPFYYPFLLVKIFIVDYL
jgi:nitrogen fixation/metabolism regulation signal transduction histidine kinase